MADIRPFPSQHVSPTSAAVTARTLPTSLNCLLVPLRGMNLLLPNSAVAELVAYSAPAPVAGAPEWFLGVVTWRERRIPVISFEAASGSQVGGVTADSRVLVLNTLQGNPRLPYIGLVTQAIPRLHVLREDTVTAAAEPPHRRQSVSAYVEIGEQNALIPDIDDLEQRLMRLQHG